MELTPLKVSNKSRYDYTQAGIAARKAKNPTHQKGRPLLPPTSKQLESHEVRRMESSKPSKKRTLKNLKSRRRMSALEKLPTELLQHIFFYCLSIDLPKSSPIIAGALSNKSIYLRIVLAAFGPSWDLWLERSEEKLQIHDFTVDAALQSAILRCRWATLGILLESRQIWLDNLSTTQYYELPLFSVARGLDETYSSNFPRDIQEYFEEEFNDFTSTCEELDGPPLRELCNWDFISSPVEDVEMPISLLAGPWTEDMLQHLFWLVKSGIQIDWFKSTNGEVAITGLRSAIMDGDVRAIHLLHWAGMQDKLDMDTIVWALQNAGGHKTAVVTHLLRLGFEDISDSDARKLGRALSLLRDEARLEEDQEKLRFFKSIRRCERLSSATNVHV